MYSHHTLDHEFEEGAETTASYVVCALPRSGSSLLCELLFGTGLAGAPAEYFDVALMRRLRERWGADGFDSYLDELLARRTGPNGVFGFKAHFFQIAEAFPERGVEKVFPALQYVYITRGDRLRQAISWSRALQTGKWASDHPARDAEPTYRRDQIDRLIAGSANDAGRPSSRRRARHPSGSPTRS
jgi:trehalose 2-sulfotransferase